MVLFSKIITQDSHLAWNVCFGAIRTTICKFVMSRNDMAFYTGVRSFKRKM